jgi:hypothetical protein
VAPAAWPLATDARTWRLPPPPIRRLDADQVDPPPGDFPRYTQPVYLWYLLRVDTIEHARRREEKHATTATRTSRGSRPVKGLSLDPDEFLEQQARREKVLKMQDQIRPGRTTPIAIRFDQFTLTRLKALAALRNTGYQTLLKEFVVERLYEEEKREGII